MCYTEISPNGNVDIYAAWQVSYYPGLLEAIEKYTLLLQVVKYGDQGSTVEEWLDVVDATPNVSNIRKKLKQWSKIVLNKLFSLSVYSSQMLQSSKMQKLYKKIKDTI